MLTQVDMITVNTPMFRMRKLRLREGKRLAQQVSDRGRLHPAPTNPKHSPAVTVVPVGSQDWIDAIPTHASW